MVDLRSVVTQWAHEHRVSDGHLAALLTEISGDLLTVHEAGRPKPPPQTGIVCRGHWWLGGTMRWRSLRLDDHTVLLDRRGEQGSINVAEFLAIMETIQYCDEMQLAVPIYSASFVAVKWIQERVFNTSSVTPEALIERVRRFNLADYDRSTLEYWDPEVWGRTPVDFGARDYRQKWDAR